MWNAAFFINSILLGAGLAMDAFSVSMANGLNEPRMKQRKMLLIAGTFGFFQALMPMIGWVCVHTIVQYFTVFKQFIPWIAFGLLGFIGGKMLYEGFKDKDTKTEKPAIGLLALLIQGVATSIDALSVGFTIADYDWLMALTASLIIALVTFFICVGGLLIGKKFGTKLAWRATVLGGVILVGIGIKILLESLIG